MLKKKVITLHKPLIMPEIYSLPLHNAVPGHWMSQTGPQSLLSVALGTLTLPRRCFCLLTPAGPLFSSPPNPTVESRDQQRFLLFFLDSLSVFVSWASKSRRTCNQGPLAVPQRRGSGEPSNAWAQTLNITLLPLQAVSFILRRQATWLDPSPHSLPASAEERV